MGWSIDSTALSHWVYFQTVDVCQWIFPPAVRGAQSSAPRTGGKLFAGSPGKATLWQTKTGAISPTGDWRAAAKFGKTPSPSIRFLQLLSSRDDKKSTGMGAQISLHRSRKWPSTRVCNVPCNIFMCVCVNYMCTTPPIAIQFQRLMLQCMRSFLFLFRRSDASCVSVN